MDAPVQIGRVLLKNVQLQFWVNRKKCYIETILKILFMDKLTFLRHIESTNGRFLC